MNIELVKQDKAKIANCNDEQLSRMLDKYSYLCKKQDESIHNLEIALEASKNKKASYKEVIYAVNIASMRFNTVQLWNQNGVKVSVDKENYNLFIKDGYIDGKVIIFKKLKAGSKIVDKLTIEQYQAVYGKELHKMYDAKLVGKNLYAVIGDEAEINSLVAELEQVKV